MHPRVGRRLGGAPPGPRMNPNAWQALMLAIAPVLSFRDVAPAT